MAVSIRIDLWAPPVVTFPWRPDKTGRDAVVLSSTCGSLAGKRLGNYRDGCRIMFTLGVGPDGRLKFEVSEWFE